MENDERFRLMFENSSDAILLAWPDGRIESANPAACRLFGYSEEDFCRLGRAGVTDATDPNLAVALAARSRTGSWRGTLRYVRSDGMVFPGEIVVSDFRDACGELRTLVQLRDVSVSSDQRQGKHLLEEQMRRLQSRDDALAAISQGVVITGVDGRITYVNPGFEAITGYPMVEILGRSCDFLHGADTDPETKCQIRAALDAGKTFHGEILNYRQDGSSFWNGLSITPVCDGTGKITQFVGVQRDITVRKAIEDQLMKYSEEVEDLYQNAPCGYHSLDQGGAFVRINETELKWLGYARSEVLGGSWSISWHLKVPIVSSESSAMPAKQVCCQKQKWS